MQRFGETGIFEVTDDRITEFAENFVQQDFFPDDEQEKAIFIEELSEFVYYPIQYVRLMNVQNILGIRLTKENGTVVIQYKVTGVLTRPQYQSDDEPTRPLYQPDILSETLIYHTMPLQKFVSLWVFIILSLVALVIITYKLIKKLVEKYNK